METSSSELTPVKSLPVQGIIRRGTLSKKGSISIDQTSISDDPQSTHSASQQFSRPSIRVKWRDGEDSATPRPSQIAFDGLVDIHEMEEHTEDRGEIERLLPTSSHGAESKSQSQCGGLLEGDSVDVRVLITGMNKTGKTSLAECLSQSTQVNINTSNVLQTSSLLSMQIITFLSLNSS